MTETVGEIKTDGTEFGLSTRLSFLIGKESARNFANRAGLKDSTLRSVLKGTRPSIDFVIAVAKATGASLEWIATGQGRPYPRSANPSRRDFDRELYDMIAQCVERVFTEANIQLAPGVSAATIIDIYDEVIAITHESEPEEYRSLMPWVEYGLKKQAEHHLEKHLRGRRKKPRTEVESPLE